MSLLESLGLTVMRALPAETMLGILTGQYTIHGGVIRQAAGTPQGGQIVAHLVGGPAINIQATHPLLAVANVVGDIVNAFGTFHIIGQNRKIREEIAQVSQQVAALSDQVTGLTALTQRVLEVSTAAMAFSGLGLLVSSMGFARLQRKMNLLETKLTELQKQVEAIRLILERRERAALKNALGDLLRIEADKSISPENKRQLLVDARRTLGEIHHNYRELFTGEGDPKIILAYEEYYSLTLLARIRCSMELGLMSIAEQELQEGKAIWEGRARQLAKDELLGEDPQRFLQRDFVETVPLPNLIAWLDFAYEERGLAWIEDLRKELHQGVNLNPLRGRRLKEDREFNVTALNKLTTRHQVYEGYMSQYNFFLQRNISPRDFQDSIERLSEAEKVNGYHLLVQTQA
jgi:hypothetical protein